MKKAISLMLSASFVVLQLKLLTWHIKNYNDSSTPIMVIISFIQMLVMWIGFHAMLFMRKKKND